MSSTKRSSTEEAAALLQQLMGFVNGRGAGKSLQFQHEAGLTFPQIITLYRLNASDEPQTVSDLAEATQLSMGATSQLIERLVKSGLVTRSESKVDRRVRVVALAAKGRALLGRLHEIRNVEWQSTLGRLPADLRERVVDVMTDVIESLRGEQPAVRARRRSA